MPDLPSSSCRVRDEQVAKCPVTDSTRLTGLTYQLTSRHQTDGAHRAVQSGPHTVTFGPEKPNISAPYGDPRHFRGQQLNSGILLPGSSFTVTFTRAGTHHYLCALHDYLGMSGTVTVRKD